MKVYASGSGYREAEALPAVIKNLRIDILGIKASTKSKRPFSTIFYSFSTCCVFPWALSNFLLFGYIHDYIGGEEEYKCQEEGVVYMYRRFRNAPAGFKQGKTDTWQECQKSCEEIDQCKGFTWHKENNRYSKACAFFSTHSGKISGKKTVSGLKECSNDR